MNGLILVCALLATAVEGGVTEQDRAAWVGQRVVLKPGTAVTVEGAAVSAGDLAPHAGQLSAVPVYRVVESRGPWLLVAGPNGAPASERRKGWAPAGQAAVIGMAVLDLSHEIRNGPSPGADLYLRRGSLLAASRSIAKAHDDLTEAVRLDPKNPRAFHVRGNLRADLGDLDGAIADFSEAVRLDPAFAPAYDDRAHARYLKGEFSQAVADLDALIRLAPGSAAAYRDRGDSRRLAGDPAGAVADLTEAVRLDRGDALAYALRGFALGARGDQDDAIANCSVALRLDPPVKLPLLYRGLAYDHKGDRVRAAADFKAGSIHSNGVNLPPGRHTRGWRGDFVGTWRDRVDLARAAEAHTAVLRADPTAIECYAGRGQTYLWWDRYDDAIADFSRFIAATPYSARSRFSRGRALAYSKEYDRAAADFTEVLRTEPANDPVRLARGMAWVGTKAYDKAVADLSVAVRARPGDAWALLLRARAWAFQGDAARAVADQTEAIRLVPDYAQAYHDRAWLEATAPGGRARDGRRAVADATRACRLTEWARPEYLATLAAALAESGDFDGAVARQGDALDLLADPRARGEALACLDLYRAKTPYRAPAAAPWPVAAETPELPEFKGLHR
jgi:tetratricopeptide (TPR) repeat protein